MKRPTTALILAAGAILALPAAASAEYLVPPGNSAATQYTETVPTAGGHRDTERQGRGGGRTAASVIGAGNARRLGKHGDDGREVAALAAETAPVETVEESPPSAPSEDEAQAGRKAKDEPEKGSGQKRDEGRGAPGAPGSSDPPTASGSSGPLEVIGRALGVSSGGTGLLLPLAVLATAAWAVAFLRRQRNRSTV